MNMNREDYLKLKKCDFLENTLEEIQKLGTLIDISGILCDKEGIEKSIEVCNRKLNEIEFGDQNYGVICYFLGNAYSNLKNIRNKNNWESENNIDKQIKYYKMALQNNIHPITKCQIYTNLGNLYDNLGQPIKSILYREKALDIDPNFTMALGTLGSTLLNYSSLVYDEGHKLILIKKSYEIFNKIDFNKNDPDCYPEAKESFLQKKISIESNIDEEFLNGKENYDNYFKNISFNEKKYRKWCLKNKLFINPLNDISTEDSYIAQDILSVPNIVVKKGEGPYFHSMFNQIKQEYVSARYLFFEGIEGNKSHFSDKGNLIYNTFDYSEYSFNLEKIKISYRIVYSLFDKISYIINIYFNLKVDYKKVNFRRIWKIAEKEIKAKENYILVGLYHLSKELYNIYYDEDCIDDEYKELDILRNFLEHKHIRIKSFNKKSFFNEPDGFAYDISKDEMIKKTYSIFSLIREAIIYLSLSMHLEERKNYSNDYLSLGMRVYSDNEKI
ncbi:MAG: LA2681 family HEPN domain-containing protein [Cetobacterium sp.]